jgi:DNA-binding NarL/FixJ family response regulator
MTVRLVLADDSFLAREGITRLLEAEDDIEIVATCSDVATLRAAIEEHRPDVILTDIRMPPDETDEGIQFAHELRSSHPTIGVVVLSQYAEPSYALALFDGGSDGRAYLLKERLRHRGELGGAIRAVHAGGSVVDSSVVEALLTRQANRKDTKLSQLTARETQILALITEGRSNGAISEALGVTKRAVEHHINQIFFKLDLGDEKDVSRRVKAAIAFLGEQNEV